MARPMSRARRRYFVRLTVFMALYLFVLGPIAWSQPRGHWPDGPLRYVLAVLPALPVFGVIWAILSHVAEEEDEYFRFLHARAALVATGLTLAACTAWGFLSTYADLPGGNLIYVFMIFCVSLFPAMAWTSWRMR